MYCRSISSLICMFMAVSMATLNRDPDSTKEWSTTESVREVRKDVGEELGPLLDDGDDTIVRLEAGGTRLVAHRAVLAARSPVLESMLRHYSGGGRLSVPGVEGPVLRQLVAYLYTLRAPRLSPGTATQLLAAAHNLGLPDLQVACERQVAAQLSVETAASAAVLAVKYSANHLRDAAVDFIKEHRVKVLATKGWADALESQPEEAAEVSRLLADRLAGICGPATPAHSGPRHAAATAAPPLAACPTAPLDEDTVSRLRNLSAEVRDSRLIEAARKGAVGELRALLAAGADVRATEDDGSTALHMAVGVGYLEAASCLLGGGAEVDARNRGQRTPLYAAAHWNRAAVARLLLAASADPNVRDEAEETPLHWAAKRGSAEVAAALLQAGADRGARDYKGQTALDHARINDQQQLIDMLTQQNLSGEVRDSRLVEAAKNGAVGELRALLVAGADVMARDGQKYTALHYAVGRGDVEAASCLLGAGAQVDGRGPFETTALHGAAFWNRTAVTRLLLAASADINARDEAGDTPLHWAAKRGSAEVAAALLQAGADLGATNNNGQTPLDTARTNDQQQLIDMLTKH